MFQLDLSEVTHQIFPESDRTLYARVCICIREIFTFRPRGIIDAPAFVVHSYCTINEAVENTKVLRM